MVGLGQNFHKLISSSDATWIYVKYMWFYAHFSTICAI